jgi:hypothetical protein
MITSKNLWDLLSKESCSNSAVDELHRRLQKTARIFQQELTLEVSDDGWVIHVHSADDIRDSLRIDIPKDRSEPIRMSETFEVTEVKTVTAELTTELTSEDY